ncbi:hypothetical protein G6N05_09860 [Flavobacterium sp. F372]|uniref:Uncharacterized protein n=1 Tax=Flavobacterium bernardetii TaxID=2813823 RepID=A0ABR7IYA7_9FLAO|nr:hypothetical protein [Flavobacterium bernardetii]MBC5834765.1 hypothetical protein [Flavobacterium bernardetii]NHF70413.1 hypothetical protein [Flavobacterium bernardetii]
MNHFYKTLKRQILILLMYTLGANFYDYFFNRPHEKGMLSPLLYVILYALIHLFLLSVYTASNHQDERKKLKNYILTIPIVFVLSIFFTILSLYLNH